MTEEIQENERTRGSARTPCYIAGDGNLLVSFSGGETSGFMSYLLKKHSSNKLIFVFANTGQENEETLQFVNNCDKAFNLGVVWVEADVQADGVGTKHKIVNFETADRSGKPFEDVVRKYGVSNKAYPHCTRELKLAPIHSYMKSLGIEYKTAIGIRADEYRRCGEATGIVYPLADFWIKSKYDVKHFWIKQSFKLGLRDYQGNCRWCWKKSFRKLFWLIDDDPTMFDFPARLEKEYGQVRCPEGRRVFFRQHNSVEDLFKMKGEQIKLRSLFDIDDGCSESCELYKTI